jgi:hypothetical protein
VSFSTGSEETDRRLVTKAKEAGVYLGRRGMGVRVAAHFWNAADDAKRLLEVVRHEA